MLYNKIPKLFKYLNKKYGKVHLSNKLGNDEYNRLVNYCENGGFLEMWKLRKHLNYLEYLYEIVDSQDRERETLWGCQI